MRILFLGLEGGSSRHRANALARAGHEVTIISPEKAVSRGRVWNKFHAITGGLLVEGLARRSVLEQIGERKFDATWVESGRFVGPKLVRELKRRNGPVMNHNLDDPYGTRDGNAWRLYLNTVPEYDLVAVVRRENITEAKALGAKRVRCIFRCADEVAHAPQALSIQNHRRWDSEVVFVGTWMTGRGTFMAGLVERGVPLSIFGGRWEKAPEWRTIRRAWKGPATSSDEEYAHAIQCGKICLGLLSKGNRDLHTQRSCEVPALGSVLCAERTVEHQHLYREGEEAVFWSDAEECAQVCRDLLADDARRKRIAIAGRQRCLLNRHYNEPMTTGLVAELMEG